MKTPDAGKDVVTFNRQWAEQVFSFSQDGITVNQDIPFSFVYGGSHSSTFISGWGCEVKSEMIDQTASRQTLTLTDPLTCLEVRVVCLIYLDTAGVDWTIFFTNKGTRISPIIEQVKAVDTITSIPPAAKAVLHRLNGAPCKLDDWMPFDQPVVEGKRVDFTATAGRSSNVSPWFNLDFGSGGVITAIGWSGQWEASIDYKDDQLRMQAGMQDLHTVLHPGESLRSPRIMQLRWQGGDQYDAYNSFRQTMFAHIMPRIDGQVVVPPVVHLSTAFYELNDSNEQNVLTHLQAIKGLGFEMFWLDAYWTGPHGFPNSMGNYGFPIERVEPSDRFPHGLKAIGEVVESEGLGFLMWFEPERVASDTLIAREHPEWVISLTGDGSGLFNLGIPEARRYMTDYLNAAIKAYRLSCLRIDYNIDPLPFWQSINASDADRAGMAEVRYIEGLYQMWDDILKENPKLFIDNCASGGRRIDLETMSRSVPLWRSDNTCDMLDRKPETVELAAIKNQLMSDGLNRYVPFSLCGQMGAAPYLFRSGFNAGIAFAEDVRPAAYPRSLLKQGIAEGKRIRKYFTGNYYPLVESGADPHGWCVLQYHCPDDKEGMLMAFRRELSMDSSCECCLRQIDPDADYKVSVYHTYELEKITTMKGTELQHLKVDIRERPGSLIIEYAVCQWSHPLEKKGTVVDQMGETTPFVFNDRLYRLENYQRFLAFPEARAADGYRFMEDEVRVWDVETNRVVSVALVGHSFGFAFVHAGRVYVFAARHQVDRPWRTFTAIDMTSSDDLVYWTPPQTVVEAEAVLRNGQPGREYLFNTAVCRADDRFVLLYETDDPHWPAFTFKYCESDDLVHWQRIPDALYGREKYVGGPALYKEGGWFYTLYLQDLNGYSGGTWETRITRSRDLVHWEDAPLDRPFLAPDTNRMAHGVRGGVNVAVREINASDVELCYWQGKTLVYFNGGDQQTLGDLQVAEYNGTPRQLFEHFYAEPALPVPSAQQLAIQERQFGAFVHFGMAAWYDGAENAAFPETLYQPYAFDLRHWGSMVAQPRADTFRPEQLDAEQWVRTAKAMGARHMVLTAKHHNGFCLWPTATTEYCVRSSPWCGGKGDVIASFATAAHQLGLGVGLYLSAGDVNAGCFSTAEAQGQRRLIGDLDQYFPMLREQFREILTNYGKLCEVWLDGALDPLGPDVLKPDGAPVGRRYWDELADLIHQLQPGAVIMGGTRPDLRWPGNEEGLAPYPLSCVVEPGQEAANWLPPGCTGWLVPEACVFTRPTWFWTPDSDAQIFDLDRLVEIYCRSIGHGANLLINMTPDRRGLIPEAEAARLGEFGGEIERRFGRSIASAASANGWSENHTLELELGERRTVTTVILEEDITAGQRVTQYHLEARREGVWSTIAEGQTIGRKRIESLPQPVAADVLRLRIRASLPLPKIRRFSGYV